MSVTELAPGLRAPQHQEGQHKGKWIRKVSHCSLFNSLLAKYPKHTHQGFPKRCCEKLNYTILLWKWHAFEKEINNGESLKECTPSMQNRGSPGKTTGIPKWTMWGCSMWGSFHPEWDLPDCYPQKRPKWLNQYPIQVSVCWSHIYITIWACNWEIVHSLVHWYSLLRWLLTL